jgi:hypothetical protein
VRTSTSVPWSALEQYIGDGGSDRLMDALIPYGSADEIAAVTPPAPAAVADQVCLRSAGAWGVLCGEWDLLAEVLTT